MNDLNETSNAECGTRNAAFRTPPLADGSQPTANSSGLRALILFTLALVPAAPAADIHVNTVTEITVAAAQARPGDTLIMRDGLWADADITFAAQGTLAAPITLRARTLGAVHLTGASRLRMAGHHLIVDGLTFTNGFLTGGEVIAFQQTTFAPAHFSRITNCAITHYSPPDAGLDTKWVSLYGFSNRVENCAFTGKSNLGTVLIVWLDQNPDRPGHHYIGHNYFGPRPPLAVNGGEAIRLGTSDLSLNNSRTTVEANLFDRCNGDAEIISSKSCENLFRGNTFLECEGALSLRHGHRSTVEGNFFLGRGRPLTGGVRIVGADHKVHNNYFSELTGTSARSPLSIMQGLVNSPLNGYDQVFRASVVHNTFYQCTNSILMGLVGTLSGSTNPTTLPPVDCVLANNIILQPAGKLVDQRIEPVNCLWQGNVFFGTSLSITNPGGILIADPQLFLAGDGLMRLNPASPAAAAAQGLYPYITHDMDGQPRTGARDSGADQISAAPILNRPLVLTDVGPLWVRTTGTVISWPPPAPIAYGTTLSATQLNATANAPGTFLYTPGNGTLLSAGLGQTLRVIFTPVDLANFNVATQTVTLDVLRAVPVINWSNPPALPYGNALSSTQLNATASVPGTFVFTPPAGTMLNVGNAQVLSATFTPNDTNNYTPVTRTVLLNVVQARPSITWATPADITNGTPLTAVQLNATSAIPGSFIYAPPAGTLLNPGSAQILAAIFTPVDTVNYLTVTQTVLINVTSDGKRVPIITWTTPGDIAFGTPLSAIQLNATADVPGTFLYSPPAGTVLGVGNGQTLRVDFSPTDTTLYTVANASVAINVAPPVGTEVIRVAYLIPANRVASSNAVLTLQHSLLMYQEWFREQMKLNGFGPKTFVFENSGDGITPLIHAVPLSVTDTWLRADPTAGRIITAARGAGVAVGTNGQVWWLIPEIHAQNPDGSLVGEFDLAWSAGGSGDEPGWAVLGSDALSLLEPTCLTNALFYDGMLMPQVGPYPLVQDMTFPWFDGVTLSSVSSSCLGAGLRQLAEAFGLEHDYRNDENFNGNLLGFGFRGLRGTFHPKLYPYNGTRLSYGAALALSVNRYFNVGRPVTDQVRPGAALTTTGAVAPINGLLHLNFTATDDQALHAALLSVNRNGEWLQIDEMPLSGQVAARAFDTPYFEPGRTNQYRLSVFDAQGNKRSVTASVVPGSAINRAPQPFLRASPFVVGPGEDVILDAASTFDPETGSSLLEVEWDFDNDGNFDTLPSTTLLTTNRYLTLGNRFVRARLTDSAGDVSISAPVAVSITLCESKLSPAGRTHGFGAGTGSVSNHTSAQCIWSVVNTNSWVTITSATNFVGPARVTYALEANPEYAERVGTLLLGDAVYTITQRPIVCTYSVSPQSRYHGFGTGSGTIKINTRPECSWAVVNTNSWISISPTGMVGTGTVTISYSILDNRVAGERLGHITVEGAVFMVGQWGTNCTFLLSTNAQEHGEGGGSGAVAVTTSGSCTWGVANPLGWVVLDAPGNVTGNGTVGYTVLANPTGAARSGVLTLLANGSQPTAISYRISQRACGFELSRTGRTHGYGAETGAVGVVTGDICPWQVSNPHSWVFVTAGAAGGTGAGEVRYTLAANNSSTPRLGTIHMAGLPYTIHQLGLPCDYQVFPPDWNHGEGFELNEIVVFAGPGCPWVATAGADWITILAGSSGTGNGSIVYGVSGNGGAARQGSIQVGPVGGQGQEFVVGQVSGLRRMQIGAEGSQPVAVSFGGTACVPVTFGARGTENSLAFSVCYDASALGFVSASLGGGAFGGSVSVNVSQTNVGRVGITVAMPGGWSMPAGTGAVVNVCLRGVLASGKASVPLVFCDAPVARRALDAVGQVLALEYYDGLARVSGDCSLGESVDATNLVWTSGGAGLWACQTNVLHDGEDAAASGAGLADSGESWVQTVVQGPGSLSWWWKVSSEGESADRLRFYLNGSGGISISGEVDWEFRTMELGSGTQTLRWRYYKNGELAAGLDRGWLDQVVFVPAPLAITSQPVSQSQQMGTTVTFAVGVSGAPPLTYQWRLNGVALVNGNGISGATGATLVLSNVQPAQAGNYSVAIGSGNGSLTSAEAALVLTPFISLAAALDADLPWQTNGAPFWTGQAGEARDGGDAARSGAVANSGSASVQVTLAGPGTVSWWWKVSSQTNGDFLRFYIGSTEVTNISGEVDWREQSVAVPSGSQTLRWTYQKNSGTVGGQDRAWVDEVLFSPQAPAMTTHPTNVVVEQGQSAVFSAAASGTPPLSYVWQRDDVDLVSGPGVSGVNSATLTLANVQPAQAGNYSVRVSNAEGSATSSNAALVVSRTVSLAEAVDWSGTTIGTSGNLPWVGQTGVSHDQADAARSGLITHSQTSSMLSTSTGPGTVSFWWKVSSQLDSDLLRFYLNGTEQGRISGESNWTWRTFNLGAGTQTLEWRYSKNTSTSTGQDRGWVDEIVIVTNAVAALPVIAVQPVSRTVIAPASVAFQVGAIGSAPLGYQWLRDGVALTNGGGITGVITTNLAISATTASHAGLYSVVVSNAAGTTASLPATLTVIAAPVITNMPVDRHVVAGASVSFTVGAMGSAPLSYQWQFNGTNLTNGGKFSGATSATLTITAVTAAQEGLYSVTVSNAAGVASSAQAQVLVRHWEAVRSGVVGHGGNTVLETSVTGPGELRFSWRVSSETNNDAFLFLLDGAELGRLSGEVDWRGEVFAVPAGSHTLRWRYEKDAGGNAGFDAGFVDEIVFTSTDAPVAPAIVVQPASLNVMAGETLALEAQVMGSMPMTFQWRRDGVNLQNGGNVSGARTPRLTLATLQPGQSGNYSLLISNAAGTVTSAEAELLVTPLTPTILPVFTTQPAGRSVFEGANVTFTASVAAAQQGGPTAAQWWFNGAPVQDGPSASGSATTSLVLTAVSPAQIGNYQLVVSNAFGVVASANAALTVQTLASAVGAPYLSFEAAGYTGWVAQAAVAQDGVDAGRSGFIPDNQNTRLESWVEGPGTVSFWWKVSSEPANDQLRFYVGSNELGRISGEVDWQRLSFPVPAGTQLLKWRYSKNLDTVGGQDAGFVDGIEYARTSGGIVPSITSQPVSRNVEVGATVVLEAAAGGSPALGFQWRLNGTNLVNTSAAQGGPTGPGGISGVRTPRLILVGVQPGQSGNYSLFVTNPVGTVSSEEAVLFVAPALSTPVISSQPVGRQVTEGAAVTFSVGASGAAPLEYQWQFNGVDLADGPGVKGASAATLTLEGVSPAHIGNYAAVVRNAVGTNTSASVPLTVRSLAEVAEAPYLNFSASGMAWLAQTGVTQTVIGTNFGARLTVSTPPTIVLHPGARTVRAGTNTSFTVAATGSAPLGYRWRFNGANLSDGPNVAGANSDTLTLVDVQFPQAGNYSVVVTNLVGTATSSNATLAVNSPPFITVQPVGQTLPEGANLSLSVTVVGTGPFGYQWRRNGVNLVNGGSVSGVTSPLLSIVGAQAAHSGAYSVVVTNLVGTVVSSNATVVLNTGLTLGEAVDAPYLGWSTGLATPWVVETNIVHTGNASSRSGAISNNQSTLLAASITGPGVARFWWRVSSQTNSDFVSFLVDGVEYAALSGEVGWNWRTFDVPEGSQLLQWVYSKDAAGSSGLDRAWVDAVEFSQTMGPSAPVITRHPLRSDVDPGATVAFTVEADGSQPLLYQWRFNGVELADGVQVDGATTPILTLIGVSAANSGNYDVVVRNPYSLAHSSNALLRITPSVTIEEGVDTALDNLNWITAGFSPWRGQTNMAYDRVDAAESGALPHNRTNWIEATIVGPAAVSYWWKVSSQTNSDRLRFYINGVERANISGQTDWRWRTFDVGTALATLRWAYMKDAAGSAGEDRGWVDQIRIGPAAPLITNESPRLEIVDQGTTVKMQAEPMGSEPFNYQWRFNGTNLAETGNIYGAVSSRRLILTNAQPNQSGVYSLVINNAAGVAISSDFTLNVIPALPLPFALNTPTWVWETGGDAWWVGDPNGSHDGVQAARNGTLGGSDTTWMQTTLVGEGTLRFWWRSSTQVNLDFLNFTINGVEQARISGETSWQQRTFDIFGATNVVRWQYTKDTLLTNGQDRVWVDQVTFGPTPPTITNHPTSLAVDSGATATFTVGHRGTAPFTYTWRLGGTRLVDGGNISGAGTATLRLTGVTPAQAGLYSVIVSNSVGGATSANASLTVTPLVALSTALDAGNLTWTTNASPSSAAPWVGQTVVSHDGVDAARSGAIADSQSTSFQTTVTGPGTINFWWRVSSESTRDFLRFFIDSTEEDNISGEIPWASRSFPVPSGTRTLRWTYSKNGSLFGGQDRGWVDEIMFTAQPVFITTQPVGRAVDVGATVSFNVVASGTPPFSYQWRFNGTPLVNAGGVSGATTNTLVLTGVQQVQSGNYSVVISNPAGSVTSTNALLTVTPTLSLAEALDTTGLTWTTNGTPPWVGTPALSHDGTDSARSGAIADGGSTYMQTTVTGPGSVAFWWKASTEPNNDRLVFLIGSTEHARISGETNWQRVVVNVPNGSQTLRWTFSKNGSVSQGQDRVWVDEVFFGAVAPVITAQPVSRAVEAGTAVSFTVGVSGTPPFTYQWRRDGVDLVNGGGISGATSSNLTLTGVQTAQAGNYSVVVANSVSNVTSANASLTVGAVMALDIALDTPGYTWATSGNQPWIGQALVHRDGVDAARSGTITDSQTSTMQTTVTGPGSVTFWWNVSSESSNDRLMFFIGSTEQARISGTNVTWQQRTFTVPTGNQTLRFTYQKNGSVSQGQDRAWVDQVVFVSSLTPVPPTITTQPISQGVGQGAFATFSVTAAGTAPIFYQWLFNGSPIAGATANSYTVPGVQQIHVGTYSCFVSNSVGTVTSAGAALTMVTMGDAVDAPGLTWLAAGNAGWIAQTLVTHDGVDAAHSSPINDNENSRLETFVDGPGVVSFWWRVSCESADNLRFYVGTNELARIAGEINWEFRTFNVPAGNHLLKWRYGKSASGVAGQDRGWVDQITYSASALPSPPPGDAGLPPEQPQADPPITRTNTGPVIAQISLTGTKAVLKWEGSPDRIYRVFYKESLADPAWTLLDGEVLIQWRVADGEILVNDSVLCTVEDVLAGRTRFYRVLEE